MAQERNGGAAPPVFRTPRPRRYFFLGASQSDIAAETGLSRFKVARLLEQARATGLVRIELDYRGELNLDLSARLATTYGLRHSIVVDTSEEDEALLRANLGRAAAE